jgi:hypothetical protein
MLDLASLLNVKRTAVWELNPVTKQIVCHPEDGLVNSLSARLSLRVLLSFLSLRETANSDPVILLRAENLATEAEDFSTRHDSQALETEISISLNKAGRAVIGLP